MAVVLRKGDPCYGEALARGDVLVALGVPVKRAAREAGVPVALLENRVKRSESCPGPRVLAYREAETVWKTARGDAKALAWCAMIRSWLALTPEDRRALAPARTT